MAWYKKLHWQIILGLILGLVFGIIAASLHWGEFTRNWISPFGTIFINLLKLIAVPLVLASLITGVASLSDLRKFSRIGGKTIAIYICTTAIAITIGLLAVNLVQPGYGVPEQVRDDLMSAYSENAESGMEQAAAARDRGPLQVLVDMVPDNFLNSASDNRNMLQVVFISILFGIGLIQLSEERGRPLLSFFESLNELIIRLVDLIMLTAPIGVFALMADTIITVAGDDLGQLMGLLNALGLYCLTVVGGLLIMTFATYPSVLRIFSTMRISDFFKGIGPAQLVAFSTSSSGATLPVTMERCEEKLGVSEEVASFVLPLGATINMDGTALYQAVAAVFIAQTLGMELGFAAQLTIVLTALLASIGTAAVPGAGIIMLVIILESVGVPSAGIALILGVDRILDMLRTVTNITGDATVAVSVASMEGQLGMVDLSEEADHIRVAAD